MTYRVTAQKFKGLKKLSSGAQDTSQWLTPTFSDEFSGGSLSPVWSMRGQDYEPSSKRKCSKGDPKAVKVTGGALRLSVIKDRSKKGKCLAKSRKTKKKISYRLNGHVGTEGAFEFTHGFAAARIRLQPARGQHGAFWMQTPGGAKPGGQKKGGAEIDVIEYFGDAHPQGGLTSYSYWLDKKGKQVRDGGWLPDADELGDDWSSEYHVFSVEWTPEGYVFRIDGQVSQRLNGETSGLSQFLVLSLLSSDYELKQLDGDLPQHMDVDWVRVWDTGD